MITYDIIHVGPDESLGNKLKNNSENLGLTFHQVTNHNQFIGAVAENNRAKVWVVEDSVPSYSYTSQPEFYGFEKISRFINQCHDKPQKIVVYVDDEKNQVQPPENSWVVNRLEFDDKLLFECLRHILDK